MGRVAGRHIMRRESSMGEDVYATIAQLQARLASGEVTAVGLVERCVERIVAVDRNGPRLRSVLEVNPDAEAIAAERDREREAGRVRGPLHGIPILLKDNIDTGDRMQTTAGSLALIGDPAPGDATVAARLREAGAVLLGTANLSEWAYYRSSSPTSGWSGRGGQTRNPHVLDRNPSGSSSGSAVAVAAGLCCAALGTETNGSIVSPSNASGVVAIKPTVGLTSRAGVIPISHSQDTVGPHARSVADAAAVLGALVGVDDRDPATAASQGHTHADYTTFLDAGGLKGARLGIARTTGFGKSPKVDAVIEEAIAAMRDAGATIIDPAPIPTQDRLGGDPEATVLSYEFKHGLNTYLATRAGVPVRTLAELIAFNAAHADVEMPHFGQERLLASEARGPLTDPAYVEALAESRRLSREEGIDAVMDEHRLDALIAPTGGPAWPIDLVGGDRGGGLSSSGPAAQAGYPTVTVPAGFIAELPINVSFIGRAFSEPTLIRLAYAFEQATGAWRAPRFLPTIPLP
jgi:amidase